MKSIGLNFKNKKVVVFGMLFFIALNVLILFILSSSFSPLLAETQTSNDALCFDKVPSEFSKGYSIKEFDAVGHKPKDYNLVTDDTVKLSNMTYASGWYRTNKKITFSGDDINATLVIQFRTNGVSLTNPTHDIPTGPELCISPFANDLTGEFWGNMLQIGLNGQGIRKNAKNNSAPLYDSFGTQVTESAINLSSMMSGSIFRFLFNADGSLYMYVTDGENNANPYDTNNIRLYVYYPAGTFTRRTSGYLGFAGNNLNLCNGSINISDLKFGKIQNQPSSTELANRSYDKNLVWVAEDVRCSDNGHGGLVMVSDFGLNLSSLTPSLTFNNPESKTGVLYSYPVSTIEGKEDLVELETSFNPSAVGANKFFGFVLGASKKEINDSCVYVGVGNATTAGGYAICFFDLTNNNPKEPSYGHLISQSSGFSFTLNKENTLSLKVNKVGDSSYLFKAKVNGVVIPDLTLNNINLDGKYCGLGSYEYTNSSKGVAPAGDLKGNVKYLNISTNSYWDKVDDLSEIESGDNLVFANRYNKVYISGEGNDDFYEHHLTGTSYNDANDFLDTQSFIADKIEGGYSLRGLNSNSYLQYNQGNGVMEYVSTPRLWIIENSLNGFTLKSYCDAASKREWNLRFDASKNVFTNSCKFSYGGYETFDIYKRVSLRTLNDFSRNYLHMEDYNENLGYCSDQTHAYYKNSKDRLLSLGQDALNFFKTSNEFTQSRNRYETWAAINHDSQLYKALENSNSLLFNSQNEDVVIIISFVSISLVLTFSFFLLKLDKKIKE